MGKTALMRQYDIHLPLNQNRIIMFTYRRFRAMKPVQSLRFVEKHRIRAVEIFGSIGSVVQDSSRKRYDTARRVKNRKNNAVAECVVRIALFPLFEQPYLFHINLIESLRNHCFI